VTAVNGFFKCIPDLQNASEYVVKVALARNAKRIVVSDDPILSEFRDTIVRGGLIEVTSPITLSREDFFGALKDAEIGVSLVDLAAAETGTLFISTSDESNRLVTALPEVHVAIVPRSKLVPSLAEAESYLSQEIRNRRAVTVSLISSSSRTSDIGDMVILGVHGPKELHVLLLG
jgi:L-lactate utilization protein LutC